MYGYVSLCYSDNIENRLEVTKVYVEKRMESPCLVDIEFGDDKFWVVVMGIQHKYRFYAAEFYMYKCIR